MNLNRIVLPQGRGQFTVTGSEMNDQSACYSRLGQQLLGNVFGVGTRFRDESNQYTGKRNANRLII